MPVVGVVTGMALKITRLQGQVAEQDADLEAACKLVIAASLSTGHAQTMTELVSEVLRDVVEMRERIAELEGNLAELECEQYHFVARPSEEWVTHWGEGEDDETK